MSAAPQGTSAGRYARAVERSLSEARGRHGVLSPREWALVASWHARGIPVAVVVEAIAEACARRRPPRSLAYVAPAVEESWRVIVSGTGREPGSPAGRPVRPATHDAWSRARQAAPDPSPLRTLLDSVVARAEAGEEPAALDAALDEALAEAAPEEIVDRARRAAREALKGYGERMTPAALEATARRAVVDRIRKSLGLPRAALRR